MPGERWLVTGAAGQLGGHVLRRLADDAAVGAVVGVVRPGGAEVPAEHVAVDLADFAAVAACVRAFKPTHIVHLGAMTAVGACYEHPERAEAVNVAATGVLGEAAVRLGARLVFASTDMVFAGDAAPYAEAAAPSPLSCYGRTKVRAEQALTAVPRAVIARIPLMVGMPCGPRTTTFASQIDSLRAGRPLRLFVDEHRTPVCLADAAGAIVGLARSDYAGIIHIAGPERLSRYDIIARCAAVLGIRSPNLDAVSREAIDAPEPRPADLSLRGARMASLLPSLVPGPAIHAGIFDAK